MSTGATRLVWRVSLMLVVVTGTSIDAQNLLTNPDFDSDLSRWTKSRGSSGDCVWEAEDLHGPSSGRANCLIDKNGQNSARIRLSQCVSAGGLDHLTAETRYFVPCGQGGSGFATLRLSYIYADGSSVQLPTDCDAEGYSCAVWNRILCPNENVPRNTESVCVVLEVNKTAPSSSFRAMFDGVVLVPVVIFANGFEDPDDTSAWSSIIGGP